MLFHVKYEFQNLLRMIFVFDTDMEDEENVDPNYIFEHIRKLLLNKKVTAAVKYLWKTCTKLKGNPDMENLSVPAKEECLFTFLLKIFIESEDDAVENENEKADNANKSEQVNKMKEEINKRKRVINYLNVRDIRNECDDCLGFYYNTFFCRIV